MLAQGSDKVMENKRTIVRFYVKSAIPSEDVIGVTAAPSGSNSQGFLGTLEPVNAMGKLITVRANPSRQNLDQSFNFELPSFWTTGGPLSLSAAVNPYGRVVEDNTQNNSTALTATFTPLAPSAGHLLQFLVRPPSRQTQYPCLRRCRRQQAAHAPSLSAR